MKTTISRYGWIVIVVIIIAILLGFSTHVVNYIRDSVVGVVEEFKGVTPDDFDDDFSESENDDIEAGLYQTGSNYKKLLKSWDALLAENIVFVENGIVYTCTMEELQNAGGNPNAAALAGDLYLPKNSGITAIGNINPETGEGNLGFTYCTNLTGIIIPDGVTHISYAAFTMCTLDHIVIPSSATEEQGFVNCTVTRSVTVGNNTAELIYNKTLGTAAVNNIEVTAGSNATIYLTTQQVGSSPFNGWYVNDSFVSDEMNITYVLDRSVTIKVEYSDHIHDFSEKKMTDEYVEKAPTCLDKGTYYYKCTLCEQHGSETYEVDALGHNFVNNVCTRCGAILLVDGDERVAGLYQTGSNYTILLTPWHELINREIVYLENGSVSTNFVLDASGNRSSDFLRGDLRLPEDGSVTDIGSYAFSDCIKLTDVKIPNSVLTIDEYAFADCTGLTSIEIPNSITYIDDYAFKDCINLSTIAFKGTVEQWNALPRSNYSGWHGSCLSTNVITCSDGTFTFVIPN